MPDYRKWGDQGRETAFEAQLKRGAQKILAEADGRTCGRCIYYTGVSCVAHTSCSTGNHLEVADPEAPACRQWEERKS